MEGTIPSTGAFLGGGTSGTLLESGLTRIVKAPLALSICHGESNVMRLYMLTIAVWKSDIY